MEKFDAVILASGDFPQEKCLRKMIENAPFLCCCDNAGSRLISQGGRMPDAIVGDGDSIPAGFMERYADIYHKVDEQDYNDLTKAVRFCKETLRARDGERLRIAILGATGMREDHTIGNIFLLPFYKKKLGVLPVMITDYGSFVPMCGNSALHGLPRQQVSIFNVSCTDIESEGLKWNAYPFKEMWQGTLNEVVDGEFSIRADGEYIVYLTHEPKA